MEGVGGTACPHIVDVDVVGGWLWNNRRLSSPVLGRSMQQACFFGRGPQKGDLITDHFQFRTDHFQIFVVVVWASGIACGLRRCGCFKGTNLLNVL